MAKAKHDAVADPKPTKKVVSTSRIFKNPKNQALVGKLASRKPLQEKRISGKHKRRTKTEHSLAINFNETIEDSRVIIQRDSAELVKAATHELFERLDKNNEDLAKQLEADEAANEPFFKPLGDEELTFTAKDGSQVGSAALSSRINKFRKFIAKEEKELESLFQQYTQVSQEICAEAEKALGSDWMKIIGSPPISKADQMAPERQRDLPAEIVQMQSRFQETIDEAGQKALEEMTASEKAFNLRRNQDKQKLLNLMDDYN